MVVRWWWRRVFADSGGGSGDACLSRAGRVVWGRWERAEAALEGMWSGCRWVSEWAVGGGRWIVLGWLCGGKNKLGVRWGWVESGSTVECTVQVVWWRHMLWVEGWKVGGLKMQIRVECDELKMKNRISKWGYDVRLRTVWVWKSREGWKRIKVE